MGRIYTDEEIMQMLVIWHSLVSREVQWPEVTQFLEERINEAIASQPRST